MLKIGTIAWLLCFVSCVHGSDRVAVETHPGAVAHYTVTISDNFGGARVRACFNGVALASLVPMNASASSQLRSASIDGIPLEIHDGRILLDEPSRHECVNYETQFKPSRFRLGDISAVLSQSQWLWRPEPLPNEVSTSVRFTVPGDGRVSLSWPQSNGVYHPRRDVFFVETFGVFGAFNWQAFSVADARIEVARLGPTPREGDVRRWLTRAVEATASVGGRFPRDRLQFVIVSVDDPGAAVAFGMVRRGGGTSILLLPSVGVEVAQLEADWVAIHELSHLWLPRLYPEDRWLSEGIATYLQEVLRARCGLQSSARAWRRIRDGFERGRRSGSGRTLADESRSMNRTGAYQRVYWAGTAFALETDLRLRRRSNGESTLFTVLNDAQRNWAQETRAVSASRVLAALEQSSGAEFIKALGERYAKSSDFPDTSYVDSPEYDDLRMQVSALADGGCKVSGESSR
ncbi:MAG: hypothetical protein KJN97_09055 [Deltaproteobacteria bacterium]|nr:hypothetical protein [Deltaproteobacteria bacterium]